MSPLPSPVCVFCTSLYICIPASPYTYISMCSSKLYQILLPFFCFLPSFLHFDLSRTSPFFSLHHQDFIYVNNYRAAWCRRQAEMTFTALHPTPSPPAALIPLPSPLVPPHPSRSISIGKFHGFAPPPPAYPYLVSSAAQVPV